MAKHDTIEKYGVKLKRLTEDKIELVRRWRNEPSISRNMVYRKEISADEQRRWFRRIDNDNNFYYIVEYQNEDLGLVHLKDVDYTEFTAEPGLFFWRTDIPTIPMRAILALHDMAFGDLHLTVLRSHILKENTKAARFSMSIGNVLESSADGIDIYSLTPTRYFPARDRWLKFIKYDDKKND